jgi:uncharacterized protein YeaO (DUF488 family)
MIVLKRAYEPKSPEDGRRVLVERLWPRGLSKERAGLDLWLKEIAPSPGLRRWYGHEPGRWPEFRRRYREELRDHPEEMLLLLELARLGPLTLVFASRDGAHSSAAVLREVLEEESRGRAEAA